MDRIDAMRLFVRVADAGSFSKAAEAAGIGQPTVSRRVQDLEHRLKVQLFKRSTRSLSLTESGARFYERAQLILSEFDDAEAEARGLDHEPVGLLRITAAQSLAKRLIAPRMCKFLKLYPHIRLDMMVDDTVVDLIEEGVDLAIRLGTLSDSALMARKLTVSRRFAYASPGYIERNGMPKHPSELVNHEALTFRQSSISARWMFEKDGDRVEVDVNGRIKASSGEVLLQAALDGLGVAIGTDWLAGEHLRSGELVPVLEGWMPPSLDMHAVWPSGHPLKGKAKTFIDYLIESFKNEPIDCGEC